METVVLKKIKEKTYEEKTTGIWIVGYVGDDGHWLSYKDDEGKVIYSIAVVKGEKKTRDDGQVWYKAKGFTLKDLFAIKPHFADITAWTNKPPPVPAKKSPSPNEAQAAHEAGADIEEVPF